MKPYDVSGIAARMTPASFYKSAFEALTNEMIFNITHRNVAL